VRGQRNRGESDYTDREVVWLYQ